MQTIVGVFDNKSDAESAINELREMSIADTDISYVRAGADGEISAHDAAGDAAANTTAGAVSGATTGGVIGTIAGLVVANGILPGLGTLFVAGPIATALGLTGAAATTAAGALTGAAAGGLVGALGGLGISADEAKDYEHRVKEGGTLVTAKVDDMDQDEVQSVFSKYDADEVKIYNT
jgi:uncharacterized membrane protein